MMLYIQSRKRVRKGKELKTLYYTSAMALYDDHVTTYNIIPNRYKVRYK